DPRREGATRLAARRRASAAHLQPVRDEERGPQRLGGTTLQHVARLVLHLLRDRSEGGALHLPQLDPEQLEEVPVGVRGRGAAAPAPAPAPAPTPATPGALPARATSRSRERRPAAARRRGAATRTSRAKPALLASPECGVLSGADRPSLQRQRLAQHSAFRVARLDRTRPRFRGARRKESIPGFPRVALLLGAVRRGFSLIELAVTIAVMGAVTVATLPALKDWLSWVAVEAASADITTALAVARSAA